MPTPADSPIELVLSKLSGVTSSGSTGKRWSACCPAHEDSANSLGIVQWDNGVVTLKCFAGCDKIDWVIVGGESGPGARPCNVAWIRSIVEQCKAAGVPVFVKQLGAVPHGKCGDGGGSCLDNSCCRIPLRDKKGGDMAEWHADLRVRQFPAVEARAS